MSHELDDLFASASTKGNTMHSHDRTMLASLAFGDPDKKNPEHDLICQYLARPETVAKIGEWLAKKVPLPTYEIAYPDEADGNRRCFLNKITTVHPPTGTASSEFHLTKGDGVYITTVGFLDVVFEFVREMDVVQDQMWRASTEQWGPLPEGWTAKSRAHRELPWRFFAEVKVARVPAGDLLRQLQLYKTFFNYDGPPRRGMDDRLRSAAPFGIVVAPWDMTESENAELVKAGFAFLKVGDDYRKWAEADAKTVAAPQFTL